MSILYRVRQFLSAAGSWTQPEETGPCVASHYLSAEALALFNSMPRYDRRHAAGVASTLQKRGHSDACLFQAALLHDIGKTVGQPRPLRLHHRVTVVLMRTFWPGLFERIGQDTPESWRYPFFVQRHHAAIGAELARRAGCGERTVGLIRRHEDRPDVLDDQLLVALRTADNVN